MLNSYEMIWVTVIYNILILFNKTKTENRTIKTVNTNTDRVEDWILYNEDTREAETVHTGLINWELREKLRNPNSNDLTELNRIE